MSQKFTKKGKDIRSYLVSQEPDIVLEVTIPGSKQPEEAQKFIWIFDAKYRIKIIRDVMMISLKISII